MTAPDPKWWGTNPSPELDRLISIIHNVLFFETEEHGPVSRWHEPGLYQDDDQLLGCAADQVAFALLDRRVEVLALLQAIRGEEKAA
jgi:hypothetical protein